MPGAAVRSNQSVSATATAVNFLLVTHVGRVECLHVGLARHSLDTARAAAAAAVSDCFIYAANVRQLPTRIR